MLRWKWMRTGAEFHMWYKSLKTSIRKKRAKIERQGEKRTSQRPGASKKRGNRMGGGGWGQGDLWGR